MKSLAEVEELIRENEVLVGGLRLGKGRISNAEQAVNSDTAFIDCIAISHEFTDHCHKETLLEADPDIPVVATQVRRSLRRCSDLKASMRAQANFKLQLNH